MSLMLKNLDAVTRGMMLSEIEHDATSGKIYVSQRINSAKSDQWLPLLKEACENHDAGWLANEIRSRSLLNATETKRKPKGGYTEAKIGFNAPEMLAEGEFNRFYIRGVCRRAINENLKSVSAYRAKDVAAPRPESEAKIGSRFDAQQLLEDLRENTGVDTALGLPAGPNSGLSVHL